MMQSYAGLPAVPGIGIGTTYVYQFASLWHEPITHVIDMDQSTDPQQEWRSFVRARTHIRGELVRSPLFTQPVVGEILESQHMILHDQMLADGVQQAIDAGATAVGAVRQSVDGIFALFQAMDDAYFASRAADIRDVGQLLVAELLGKPRSSRLQQLPPNTILLAVELSPFQITLLDQRHIAGIGLAESAPTAHTAILARSLGIPLVCSLGPTILNVGDRRQAIIDSEQGVLLINPDHALQRYATSRRHNLEIKQLQANAQAHLPAITLDGVEITVQANINNLDQTPRVHGKGADGIGLLRTEYLFLDRTEPPTAQEQFQALYDIDRSLGDLPLTIRMLDLGGDKPIDYLPLIRESNPFLGVRGVRLLLKHPDLLRQQVQAVVQLVETRQKMESLPGHPLIRYRLLIPMVSTLDEFQAVQVAIHGAVEEERWLRIRHRIQIGVMIEVPSAALLARQLASQVDFFSIGTNDLAQYTLAADRTNSQVAGLATALDPAVLHLIRLTCQAGTAARIPVAVCGEVASDLWAVPLLLGLGVTELSVVPPMIALVKQTVRRYRQIDCQALAERALDCGSVRQVQELLHSTG